jgi:hypothetical protein
MTNLSTRRKCVVLLLSGVLLLLQISGAHLHLCFDGQEPPVSLHVLDAGAEHIPGFAFSQHQDEELDVGLASLIKKSLADFDAPPIPSAIVVLQSASPSRYLLKTSWDDRPVPNNIIRLLPPLRGPPATTLT